MWRCPQCGHRFVTARTWHSCGRFKIADHFAGKPPALRAAFRRYVAAARENGPVHVYAQKTRIVLQVCTRFAGAMVRSRWLECAVVLQRRLDDPRFTRIEHVPPKDWVHSFRLAVPTDVDDDVRAWLAEAYRYGTQETLVPRRIPRRVVPPY